MKSIILCFAPKRDISFFFTIRYHYRPVSADSEGGTCNSVLWSVVVYLVQRNTEMRNYVNNDYNRLNIEFLFRLAINLKVLTLCKFFIFVLIGLCGTAKHFMLECFYTVRKSFGNSQKRRLCVFKRRIIYAALRKLQIKLTVYLILFCCFFVHRFRWIIIFENRIKRF